MLIKQLTGQILDSDTVLAADPNRIEAVYEADEAIPVGSPIQFDKTGNTTGKLAIVALAAEDELFCGIYEGKGGTGAPATLSGTSGQAAVDGDIILGTVLGVAKALFQDTTTAVVAGDFISIAANGLFRKQTTLPVAGMIAPAFALAPYTNGGTAVATSIMVRLL